MKTQVNITLKFGLDRQHYTVIMKAKSGPYCIDLNRYSAICHLCDLETISLSLSFYICKIKIMTALLSIVAVMIK